MARNKVEIQTDSTRTSLFTPSPEEKQFTLPDVWLKRVILLLSILIVWEGATGWLKLFNPIILPPPSSILKALRVYMNSGLMARDLSFTLTGTLLALGLGILAGSSVGLVLGYLRSVAEVLEPILVALNSMPRVALAPVVMVWFGLGLPSKVFLGLFTVFFVVFFNTFFGVRSVDHELIKAVKVMGASPHQIVRYVIVPSVFSWIFAALRSSVSYALSGVVVGEFVGSSRGLGYRMAIAAGVLDTPRVFAILFILGLVSALLITVAGRIERYVLRWRPSGEISL